MKEIKAIIRSHRLDSVLQALHQYPDLPGVTVSNVRGFGRTVGRADSDDINSIDFANVAMAKVETVVDDSSAEAVTKLIEKAAHTGRKGDGKIFVVDVTECVRISNGSRGSEAL